MFTEENYMLETEPEDLNRVKIIEEKTKMNYNDFLKLDVLEQMRLYNVLDLYTDKEKEEMANKQVETSEGYFLPAIAILGFLGVSESVLIGGAIKLTKVSIDSIDPNQPLWVNLLIATPALLFDAIPFLYNGALYEFGKEIISYMDRQEYIDNYYKKKEEVKKLIKKQNKSINQ